jgi:hypothetical protein
VLRKAKPARAAKATTLTPELRQRILELFHGEFSSRAMQTREMHSQIANRLWVKRQLVADVIREQMQVQATMTEQIKQRAIEMYQRFVESGHRPDGGANNCSRSKSSTGRNWTGAATG